MAKLEISCPHHGIPELIEVPDSYRSVNFEGVVECGDEVDPQPLKIELLRGELLEVEPA